MKIQVWIILILFIIQITYAIFASLFSRVYREMCFKNKVSMGIYYFATIIVFAVLLLYGTYCVIDGQQDYNACQIYSWLLVLLIVIMIIYTIIRSIILIVKERKSDKKNLKK